MGTAAARRNLQNSGNNPQPVIQVDEAGNRQPPATGSGITTANSGIPAVGTHGTNVAATQQIQPRVDTFGGGDANVASTPALLGAGFNLGFNGTTWDRVRTPNTFKPFSVTVASIGTGQTVWDPAADKRFRVMGFAVTSDKAVQVNFKDGSVATIFSTPAVVAATPFGVSGIGNGMLSASANNLLTLDVSASVPVVLTGTCWGTEE